MIPFELFFDLGRWQESHDVIEQYAAKRGRKIATVRVCQRHDLGPDTHQAVGELSDEVCE